MTDAPPSPCNDARPLVSVLIPSYNHAAYIGETIASIIEQPYPNIELIIVDDGSQDDTRGRVESLRPVCEQRFARFLFLEKLNEGINRTLNVAIGLARGEFVALIASDDTFIGDRLSGSVQMLLAEPRCAVVYANGQYWDGQAYLKPVHHAAICELLRQGPKAILHYLQTNVSEIWIQSALFRRSLLAAVAGFDEAVLADDWVLNMRVFRHLVAHDLVSGFLDQPVFAYRMHAEQSFRNPVRQFRRVVETIAHYTPAAARDDFYARVLAGCRQQALLEHGRVPVAVHDAVAPSALPVWRELALGEDRPLKPGYLHQPRVDLLDMVQQPPGVLLDIGCNTGATGELARQRYPGVRLIGLELNPAAAAVAARHYDVLIRERIEAVDWGAYGVQPGSLDLVVLADVLEHFHDPWSVLENLKPLLSADAQLLVSLPNVRNLCVLNRLAKGYWSYEQAGLLDVTHIRFFTLHEMRRMFAECGYQIVEMRANWDGRVRGIDQLGAERVNIETDRLIIKDVDLQEGIEFAALQFLFRLRALPAAGVADGQAVTASVPQRPPPARHDVPPHVPTPPQAPGVLRVLAYSLDVHTAACAQIRLLRPMQQLQPHCRLDWAYDPRQAGFAAPDAERLREIDLIVVQRAFPGEDTAAMLEAIFASGKPVVYETDDLLIDLPADNPHHEAFSRRRPYIEDTMRRAHALVVSTPMLAQRLAPYNARVVVLPNLLDYPSFYRPLPDNRRQVNIAVAGTSARAGDFMLIDAALRTICDAYGSRIRIKFIGAMPESWVGHANAEAVPFALEYGAYAARMKGLELDIGLAPLADNPFNACKSAIKWMEFSALGMAGVYSHVPAYRDVIAQGKTGLLVDNRPEKWVTALRLLIDNPDFRREIALSAQLEVSRAHSLQRHAPRVLDTYRDLLRDCAGQPAAAGEAAPAEPDYYALWQAGHGYPEWGLRWLAARMTAWRDAPTLHLGVICRAGHEDRLTDNIKSLVGQFHKGWRLTVLAEVPAPALLHELPQVVWRQAEAASAYASLNQALWAWGDWVGMVEAGDRLPPHASFAVADAALNHPAWRMLYSDEDRLAEDGSRHTPFFKTDFNPDLLRAAPFSLGGLMLLQRALFAELGGFAAAAEGVAQWDLALRASERLADDEVGHVADVLYHRAEAGGHCLRPPEAVWQAAGACLRQHLERLGRDAAVEDGALPGSFRIRHAIRGEPLVSIIVSTRNQAERLRTCLTSLIEGTGYSRCEVLVVDNGSDDPDALAYLQALRDLGSGSLKVLSLAASLNRCALHNQAARQARGEYLLLLGDDTQVLHQDWLAEMLGYAQRADVGAVGARLLQPGGAIQHAGIILGLGGMGCDHVGVQAAGDDAGYYGRLMLPQGYSALSAACLLTRRADYQTLGGLDETLWQSGLSEVDYCLKLRQRGLKVIWTPYATLRQQPSEPPAAADLPAREAHYQRVQDQVEALVQRWPRWFAHDPAYNRNLSLILPFQPEPTPALTWDPEWRPAPRVLSIHADAMGCGEYRITAPMRALTRAGKVMGWDAAGYFHPREYARMDPESVVFQRQLEWGQIEFMQRIARITQAFRVYELDDLITNIPVMSSQKRLFVEQKDVNKRFRKAVSLCHRFVVSTAYLAESFKGYCDDIVVVPNRLERARWDGHAPTRRGGARARVGWAGSATHAGDLRLIIDVVKATADEVDWVFFGMCPDAIRPLVKEYHEPVKLADYAARLASLELDLAIAPLEDIPFNHGKSHLRLLEYGVLGYPVVCTDITPYRGAYPVTRVPNKFKAWVDAIRERVAERAALAREGDALRAHVQQHWMLDDHLDDWLRAWLP